MRFATALMVVLTATFLCSTCLAQPLPPPGDPPPDSWCWGIASEGWFEDEVSGFEGHGEICFAETPDPEIFAQAWAECSANQTASSWATINRRGQVRVERLEESCPDLAVLSEATGWGRWGIDLELQNATQDVSAHGIVDLRATLVAPGEELPGDRAWMLNPCPSHALYGDGSALQTADWEDWEDWYNVAHSTFVEDGTVKLYLFAYCFAQVSAYNTTGEAYSGSVMFCNKVHVSDFTVAPDIGGGP